MLINYLRADLVNLACKEYLNSSVTPKLEEQDGVEASRFSDEDGDEDNKTTAYQPPTVNRTVLCTKDLMLPILTLK